MINRDLDLRLLNREIRYLVGASWRSLLDSIWMRHVFTLIRLKRLMEHIPKAVYI